MLRSLLSLEIIIICSELRLDQSSLKINYRLIIGDFGTFSKPIGSRIDLAEAKCKIDKNND